jgi:CheY-like chemotaxis protein
MTTSSRPILLVEDNDDDAELLREIRETPRTSCLPVVVLTSSDEHSDLLGAYSNHANSYVRKPVDSDLFVSASSQLGLYWTVTNLGVL